MTSNTRLKYLYHVNRTVPASSSIPYDRVARRVHSNSRTEVRRTWLHKTRGEWELECGVTDTRRFADIPFMDEEEEDALHVPNDDNGTLATLQERDNLSMDVGNISPKNARKEKNTAEVELQYGVTDTRMFEDIPYMDEDEGLTRDHSNTCLEVKSAGKLDVGIQTEDLKKNANTDRIFPLTLRLNTVLRKVKSSADRMKKVAVVKVRKLVKRFKKIKKTIVKLGKTTVTTSD